MSASETRDQILSIAHRLLVAEGLSALSFDAIARRLGRSKQAVLYWFPTRQDLLAALFLPALRAEAEAVTCALDGAADRNAAIARFVRGLIAFHCQDLDRFRLMYLLPQTSRGRPGTGMLDQVHNITDGLYGALARHLDPAKPDAARAEALFLHAGVLGMMMMHGLAEAVDDPLKHGVDELADAMIDALTRP